MEIFIGIIIALFIGYKAGQYIGCREKKGDGEGGQSGGGSQVDDH